MAGRIITLQRQARELGRLRMGWSEPYTDKFGKEKRKPVKSTTWVLTSPQREYLDAAVEAWGGQVEPWQPQGNGAQAWRVITEAQAIDAILPPGDPLSQTYEMWSRGGCQRRCDGETEQMSAKPCLCRVEFGDEFHLQPPEKACRPHTRLSVVLPEMPDLGVWRVETHGFYAANEIAAAVDLIQLATGGTVAVPVRLRIEPRTRVAQGKTKQFLVLALEIRGATAGQILAGRPATIALDAAGRPAIAGPEVAAIGAAPAASEPETGANGQAQADGDSAVAPALTKTEALRRIGMAKNQQQLDMVKEDCRTAGLKDRAVLDAWTNRSQELHDAAQATEAVAPSAPPTGEPIDPDVVDGEQEEEPDANAVWAEINGHVGRTTKWKSPELEDRVIAFLGKDSGSANGFELAQFRDALKAGQIA